MARKLIVAIVFCVLVAGCPFGSRAYGAQAFSIPLSDRVIQLELTFPGGRTATVVVRDGTMVTTRDEERGYSYGFVCYLDKGQAILLPFEVVGVQGGNEKVKQVGDPQELLLGSVMGIDTAHGKFGVRLKSIETWSFPTIRPLAGSGQQHLRPSDLEKIYGKSGGGTCCVSCGPLMVCGTSVDMSCGSCDSSGSFRAI